HRVQPAGSHRYGDRLPARRAGCGRGQHLDPHGLLLQSGRGRGVVRAARGRGPSLLRGAGRRHVHPQAVLRLPARQARRGGAGIARPVQQRGGRAAVRGAVGRLREKGCGVGLRAVRLSQGCAHAAAGRGRLRAPSLDRVRLAGLHQHSSSPSPGGLFMTHAALRRSGTGVALLVFIEMLVLPCSPRGVLHAQNGALTEETYATPPQEIAEFVLAPRHQNVSVTNTSPDGTRFAWLAPGGLARLADRARPHYNLAGLQIDPAANRARSLTTHPTSGLELISCEDGSRVRVQVPEGAKVSEPRWSPDGSRIAFFVHLPDATHIYVADAATGRSRRITRTP